MSSTPDPAAGADTALAQRTATDGLAQPSAAEDDASIVWERDPADAEDAEPAPPAAPTAPVPAAPASSAPPARRWSDDAAQAFRGRWRQVQLRFVDDPAAAVRDAGALVTEATEQLAAIIVARRDELAVPGGADTERLRVAVRRYRAFLDRILEL